LVASMVYLALRRVLAVVVRQTGRPRLRPADRDFLAAAGCVLPRCRSDSLFVTPETLMRWHRALVARRWTHSHRSVGRPPVAREIRELVLRLARENPTWGYQRIAGEVGRLGSSVSTTTVRELIRAAGLGPAGKRAALTWRMFIRAQAASLSAWTAQQARQLAWSLAERASPLRFLIRDRYTKFSVAFDEVFPSEVIRIIKAPIKAPKANAYAERFVGAVRRECLDWILIINRRQLERVLGA
jgi:putative transposase